ncbi:MAG: hypothetical protein O3C15_11765 [Proteobacteria bacterium]|nr:hypothetical protein [Pseudomonadota bacterium]
MTRFERIVYVLLAAYVCCLLGLHALYYAGVFTALERDSNVLIHATRTTFVCVFFVLISIQAARRGPLGLLIVAAASYSIATFIEDFLVLESSFFLPEHTMAAALYTLRPLFVLMLVYWGMLRRSIETT